VALILELLPFAILGAEALLLAARWDAIPERFPIHWGLDGQPNGWATRSPAWVYGPLALAAALCLLLLALRAARPRAASEAQIRFRRRTLLGAECVVAVTFGAVGLLPLVPRPGLVIAVALVSVGLLVGFAVRGAVQLARAHPPDTGLEHWKWGLVYVNPDDPTLFVRKRLGYGYTLNFGRRAAWLALALILAAPIALALSIALLM
jgi:uncharacterized membrane protein